MQEHYDLKYKDWSVDDPSLIKAKKEDHIVLKELLLLCRPSQNFRILELGCGVGYKSQILYELGNNVTAIDLSETAILKARKWWNKNIDFRCYDFFNMPIEVKFDVIYASSFSPLKNEFKKNEFDVLSNIFSRINSGGYFVFEWGSNSKYSEKYNGWSYISIKDVKQTFPLFGQIIGVYANHRQLATIFKKRYFSKLFTTLTPLMSLFHNKGYRLYVIVKKY